MPFSQSRSRARGARGGSPCLRKASALIRDLGMLGMRVSVRSAFGCSALVCCVAEHARAEYA
eukprot:11763913-Alexandrium_andersonii.AAC.1